jgi:small subunit ribosomal protein S17
MSPRTRIGIVRSNKMDKTAVVEVVRYVRHPLYKKYVRRRVRYMAHDGDNSCNIGDEVKIVESRPMSRRKRWRVLETVRSVR